MRIVVTGGAGFIGSNFVRSALGGELSGLRDAQFTVLDKLTYCGRVKNIASMLGDARLSFVRGDICDADLIDRLMADHDAVVHFAAETHVDRSVADGDAFVRTNVLGTQTLLAAAVRHGIRRFVHVSTDEVYGSIDRGSWREDQVLDPSSPYSAAKAGSDLLALAYHRTHGLPVVVTRCSNNYGPYQFPEKVIPLFVLRLLARQTVPVYGTGQNVRDWLHVSDHCRGVALALLGGRPGEVYHIGGGLELTNLELTARIVKACDASWDQVVYVEDRPGHDRRYSLDHSKITEELGYRPLVDFERGLAATVEWYRTHQGWWESDQAASPS
ncbi:dTDP-glucose 4,6-dehydratase [Nucisporomicrobium flavum]|uniref:dTDP-glucose 4,6-dehydratase n=1 Tax=Nucisporomicrobium flavum TaxID=2785915 RepID=UPI0018F76A3A|nr:dTDP-glucose 4,6-dehydratase [Nucisporomicrobium flavum]